jgi:hypothetical protein
VIPGFFWDLLSGRRLSCFTGIPTSNISCLLTQKIFKVVRFASVHNNLKKRSSGNMNWYKQLFGVHETLSNYNTTQKNFAFDYQNGVLTSLANGQSFVCGRKIRDTDTV